MTDHIQNKMNEIPIPSSLHTRCEMGIEEAVHEQKGRITMLKFPKKAIAAAVALILTLGALAGSNTALAKDIRGYFADVFRFDGAVVGTEYNNATEEITLSAENITVNENAVVIPLRLTFEHPNEAPFSYIEELSMHDVTICDANGKELLTIADSERTPVLGNSAIVTVTVDCSLLSEGDSYTIRCATLRAHEKADAPLDIHGTWSYTFTVS